MIAAFFADFEAYRPAIDQPIDVEALLSELFNIQEQIADTENLKVDTAKIFIDGVTEGNPFLHPLHYPICSPKKLSPTYFSTRQRILCYL